MSDRLDNFTDAAFAFAVSLMVIGGAGAPQTFDALVRALTDLPAFAFGFAVMAMFWLGHVRWRKVRGDGDWLSILLTLTLIFLTLIYVQPLRGMATATALWFTGQGREFGGSLTGLFAVYGTGFVLMSATMTCLWAESLRGDQLTPEKRANAGGERGIWTIMALTGLVSILISTTRYGMLAAMVYATLPISIGLFVWRHNWTGKQSTAVKS